MGQKSEREMAIRAKQAAATLRMSKHLKPCPVCGHAAYIWFPYGHIIIGCPNWKCPKKPQTSWKTAEEDAMEDWNDEIYEGYKHD